MKKLTAIVLCLALLCGISAQFTLSASAKTKYGKYKGVLSSTVNRIDSSTTNYGFYYDFNKDGVKELVMLYAEDYDPYTYKFSVYTIRNNKAKKICKDKEILQATGPHNKAIGVAKKGGKRYLVTLKEYGSGDADYNSLRKLKITYYKISKTKIKKYKTASLSGRFNCMVNPVKTKKRVCKISGKKVSYSKYCNFLKSFSYKNVKTTRDSYWRYQTIRGSQSLDSLENMYWAL